MLSACFFEKRSKDKITQNRAKVADLGQSCTDLEYLNVVKIKSNVFRLMSTSYKKAPFIETSGDIVGGN